MMLEPLYDGLEAATMLAQVSRQAMNRIREKMMAQQKGEAFYDIGPAGSLDIPAFLRRQHGEPPDTTPMPAWITNAQQPKESWGGRRIEGPIQANDKREANRELKKQEAAEAEKLEAKARARRDQRLGKETAAPAPSDYWDAGANKWRAKDYMSASRYRSLLASMPTEEHRKIFVELFGHTQKPEEREPSTRTLAATRRHAVEVQQRPAAPKEAKPKKAAAPAGAAPRERKLNPEHDAKVSAMLTRPEGATLGEIGAAMGWQEHSASAFLTGIRKTRTIVKTVEARGNVYRLESKS